MTMRQYINDWAYGLFLFTLASILASSLYKLFVVFAEDFWLAIMFMGLCGLVHYLTLSKEEPVEERDTRPMSEQLSDLIDNGPKKETR